MAEEWTASRDSRFLAATLHALHPDATTLTALLRDALVKDNLPLLVALIEHGAAVNATLDDRTLSAPSQYSSGEFSHSRD